MSAPHPLNLQDETLRRLLADTFKAPVPPPLDHGKRPPARRAAADERRARFTADRDKAVSDRG